MTLIEQPTREYGVTGLKQSAGIVSEEWMLALQGSKATKVYAEMRDNDSVIAAYLFAIDALLRSVVWAVHPAEDGPDPEGDALFVEQCRDDMSSSWSDTLTDILSMLPFGWSYTETVYKKRGGPDAGDSSSRSRYSDGKYGWRKWAIRSQETLDRWEFDENGGIRGLWQQPPLGSGDGTTRFIPIEKSLLFRTTAAKGNPEGRSLLRSAYVAWWRKKRIEEIESIGVERDLVGIPLIGVPPELFATDAGSEQRAALEHWKSIGRNLRVDEQACVVYPLDYTDDGHQTVKIELASTSGARLFDTGSIVQRYSTQIAMSVLADVLLIGHGSTGSFALVESKQGLFFTALQAFLISIADVINTHAIPRLFDLNGMTRQDGYPRFVPGVIEQTDSAQLTESLERLGRAGMPLFPDANLEAHLRGVLGLPEPDDEDQQLGFE